jgi:hypothetical protein
MFDHLPVIASHEEVSTQFVMSQTPPDVVPVPEHL